MMDMVALKSFGFWVFSTDYMCCSASCACSVYTSSFPAHAPMSKCAPRCKLRCLSRENKLNLQQEDGQKTEDVLMDMSHGGSLQ